MHQISFHASVIAILKKFLKILSVKNQNNQQSLFKKDWMNKKYKWIHPKDRIYLKITFKSIPNFL